MLFFYSSARRMGDFELYQSNILTNVFYFHSSVTFGYFLQHWQRARQVRGNEYFWFCELPLLLRQMRNVIFLNVWWLWHPISLPSRGGWFTTNTSLSVHRWCQVGRPNYRILSHRQRTLIRDGFNSTWTPAPADRRKYFQYILCKVNW